MRLIALVLALSLLAGCSLVEIDENKVIVAKVGDRTISKAEFDEFLRSNLADYGYTPESSEIQAQLPELKTDYLEAMIDNLVVEIKAEEAGYVATQVDIDAAYQEAQDWYDEQLTELVEYYKEDESVEDPEAKAAEDIKSYMTLYGYDSLDAMAEKTLENFPKNKLYSETVKDTQVTDEYVEDYFYGLVDGDEEKYKDDMTTFIQDYSGGMTIYWQPEGAYFVKQILIALSDEDQEKISELRDNGDDAGADAYREEALKTIKAKVDEVLAKVLNAQTAEDFDALIDEYGEDPGLQVSAASEQDGYPYAPGITGIYVDEFAAACEQLKQEGDVSVAVATDYGYHIIRRYGDMPSGPVEYDEEMAETLHARLLSSQQSAAFDEALEKWKEELNVQRFENKL